VSLSSGTIVMNQQLADGYQGDGQISTPELDAIIQRASQLPPGNRPICTAFIRV
jgi:hypothetical protein